MMLVRMARKQPRKRERKARPTRPSRIAEAAYKRELLQVVAQMKKLAQQILLPVLQSTEGQYIRQQDGKTTDGYAYDILEAFERMSRGFGGIDRIAARMAATAVARQEQETSRQLALNLDRSLGLGIDLIPAIKALNVTTEIETAVIQNTGLIKSLPAQAIEKMQGKVMEGARAGRRYEALAKDIEREFRVTANRAKLIARDQMAKVNSAITEAKQVALGITEYEWVTAGDERVREDHRANNGKVFKWSDPPATTGHPGDDVNCRCIARPIIKIE